METLEPMLDIKEYLKQTKTVLVTQDAFDELVKKASAQQEYEPVKAEDFAKTMSENTIYRQAAIDALGEREELSDTWTDEYEVGRFQQWRDDVEALKKLPSAQPEQPDITLESAIDYLHSIGWMQEHDRAMTEYAQPEIIRCKDCRWSDTRPGVWDCHNPVFGDGYVYYSPPCMRENDYCSRAERRTDEVD